MLSDKAETGAAIIHTKYVRSTEDGVSSLSKALNIDEDKKKIKQTNETEGVSQRQIKNTKQNT